MGTDNVAFSLKTIGQSTLFTILLLPLLGMAAAGMARFIKPPFSPPRILLLILSALGLSLTFVLARFFLESFQYHCLSLFLAAGVWYYACRFFKGVDTAYPLQVFCLFLSALLVAARVLLNMGPELYGFYLVVPGLICYHLIVFQIISPFLLRCFPVTPKLFLESVYICLLLFLALGWWAQSDQLYKQRTAKMVTEKGTFCWFDDEQTSGVFLAVAWLRQNTLPEATVTVFPEGVGVNFFSGRKNPLRYCNFMPPYSPDLNPTERVWKLTRRLCTHNIYFQTLQDLVTVVQQQFARWSQLNLQLRKLCTII